MVYNSFKLCINKQNDHAFTVTKAIKKSKKKKKKVKYAGGPYLVI